MQVSSTTCVPARSFVFRSAAVKNINSLDSTLLHPLWSPHTSRYLLPSHSLLLLLRTTMSFTLHILYPSTEGARFDLDYYISSHMPMAEKLWKPLGLLKWEFSKFGPGLDGRPSPYIYGNTFTFRDAESFQAAMAIPEIASIGADVAKFTDIVPVFLPGGVVYSS